MNGKILPLLLGAVAIWWLSQQKASGGTDTRTGTTVSSASVRIS